ncbi:hypothetical protein LOK49_LG10G02267 [Camellia lanceoleosa]|uniref:Uncharacterized protein n=1 Tax=Camellia lanceoleosa TaxID=1840588 RepID=A0ACC0GAK6_9ERIC|nr:hypothetical protein LOK49_LG10G02267 [Camellia lanceoleosa]
MSSFDPIVSIKVSSSMDGYPVKIPKGMTLLQATIASICGSSTRSLSGLKLMHKRKVCMMQIHQKQVNT